MTAVHRTAGFTAIALLVSLVRAAATDPVDPPDISSQTLEDYSVLGYSLAEENIRRSMYLDSLGSELHRLYLDVDGTLTDMPDVQLRFRESHRLFVSSVEAWSDFLEEAQWRDPLTGEAVYGSVYGYTFIQVTAALYWDRILLYRILSSGDLSCGLDEITVPSDRIGGY